MASTISFSLIRVSEIYTHRRAEYMESINVKYIRITNGNRVIRELSRSHLIERVSFSIFDSFIYLSSMIICRNVGKSDVLDLHIVL